MDIWAIYQSWWYFNTRYERILKTEVEMYWRVGICHHYSFNEKLSTYLVNEGSQDTLRIIIKRISHQCDMLISIWYITGHKWPLK